MQKLDLVNKIKSKEYKGIIIFLITNLYSDFFYIIGKFYELLII